MFGRRMHPSRLTEVLVFAAFVAVIALFAFVQARRINPAEKEMRYGATFSISYATSLGLDWRRAYTAVLDELKVETLRLPVYWSDVEWEENQFYWADVDWMVEEAGRRGVAVTLAIGRKVPRWPECYIPDWAEQLSPDYQNQALLDFLEIVVNRYEAASAVERWQVENEPFYDFGDCPTPDYKLFKDELALVRRLSDKPVMLSTSGENEFWTDTALPADVLGVSMYRTTWNPLFGYTVYPIGPDYYAAKATAVRPFVDAIVVSELQAEPWLRKPIKEMTTEELVREFDGTDLKENVTFARDAGFDEVYFWGVEYWYWMHLQEQSELWQTGREIIKDPYGE